MGCVGLKPLNVQIGEVKRFYVRSAYRRQGIGRALLTALIKEAQEARYIKLRLDHAPWARSAQYLYRSIGFQEIEPYSESEIPEQYHQQWYFLELAL